MRSVPDYLKKYLSHPRLVESGLDGLPNLIPGRFYMLVHSSHSMDSHLGGRQIWLCDSKPTDHGEYSRSYGMLSVSTFETGQSYVGFCYKWFGKGGNIIIELREEQQAAYRAFHAALKADEHNESWDWCPRD